MSLLSTSTTVYLAGSATLVSLGIGGSGTIDIGGANLRMGSGATNIQIGYSGTYTASGQTFNIGGTNNFSPLFNDGAPTLNLCGGSTLAV